MLLIAQRPPLNVGALLVTVFASILEVFLLCLAGYILAMKGILDKKTQKQMNRINVSLFTPCLLFSKVAFFLSPEKLRELWVIPIFFIIVTTVSMGVAWFLGVTFRLSRSQRSFAIAASMFMNSNSLPVALMQSLVVTVHGLKWTPDDNKNAMVGRALTYLVLYSTFGMILRWSYGVRLLAQADDPLDSPIRLPDDEDEEGQRRFRDIEAGTGVLPSTSTSTMVDHLEHTSTSNKTPSIVIDDTFTRESPSSSNSSLSDAEPPPSHAPVHKDLAHHSLLRDPNATLRARPAPPPHRRTSYFYRSFPNSPNQSRVSLANQDDSAEPEVSAEDSEPDSIPESGRSGSENGPSREITHTHRPRPTSHFSTRSRYSQIHSQPPVVSQNSGRPHPHPLKTYLLHPFLKFWHGFTDFMTVPLYAALLSIIVALVSPLQHALDVHMQPVKGALESAGACSIPVTLVVLGAYFYKEREGPMNGAAAGAGVVPTRMEGVDQAGEIGANGNANGDVDSRCKLPGQTHRSEGSTPSAIEHIQSVFHLKSARRADEGEDEYEDKPLPGETKTVLITVLSRMVLTPLVLMPLVTMAAKQDWHRVFEDPVFVVANVLLISSPPALTLAQITQAASGDAFERLISRTIFWAYCVVTPPLTIMYVVVGLVLAGL